MACPAGMSSTNRHAIYNRYGIRNRYGITTSMYPHRYTMHNRYAILYLENADTVGVGFT